MRSGGSLVLMLADKIRGIVEESQNDDFSSNQIDALDLSLLDAGAVSIFRERWHRKTGNAAVLAMPDEQVLEDSELTIDGRMTLAALILLGTHKAVGRYLAQSEVIWEYREGESNISASQRVEYRSGFLTYHNELWNLINARNTVISIREGLFRSDIPAFNEDAVREAILNAVCHRDYRLGGSVFIRQFPKRMEISSPGGLPDGITEENIIRKQFPRNRRLAQACEKCGLVERSGQGMDRIYNASLREGKGQPNFSGTDDYEVRLHLQGEVIDPLFVQLLELASGRDITLTVQHLIVLDDIRQGISLSDDSAKLVPHLINIGLVERIRKSKRSDLILSRGMYTYLGQTGVYTRERGLAKETNKELLLQCIRDCGPHGASLEEFRQVLHTLDDRQIRHLVYELKEADKIFLLGRAKSARWTIAEKPR